MPSTSLLTRAEGARVFRLSGSGLARCFVIGLAVLSMPGNCAILLAALLSLAFLPEPLGGYMAAIGLTYLAAFWAHEGGHALAHRWCTDADEPGALVTRWWTAELMRVRLAPLRDLIIAVAGPVAGAVVGVLATSSLFLVGSSSFVPVPAGAIAAAHLLSLVLPGGDSLECRQALRRHRTGDRGDVAPVSTATDVLEPGDE